MWVADQWKDYELLDCGGGEKLERWGDKLLVRPDPQAIWNTPRSHRGWKRPDARYARSSTGGGQWADKSVPQRWQVNYKDLTFNVGLMNFKHTGVFPEQAANWDFARERIQNAGRPVSVLNLFAYTGGATIACAEDRPIRWIVDDCAKFVEREIRRGRKYDAIIMDPPSYGRGPSGEVWKLEENLYPFVELVAGVLSDNPLFVILNSYTTGLSPSVLTYILQTVIGGKFGGHTVSDELGLPVTQTGLALPCGAAGRWTRP